MNDMALKFDTLAIVDRLQRGGFTSEQARTQAAVLADVLDADRLGVATREDLHAVEQGLKADIQSVRSEIAELRHGTRLDIADLRHELKLQRWMTGFLLAGTSSIMYKLFLAPAAGLLH